MTAMTVRETLGWAQIGDLAVVVHGDASPDNAEWSELVAFARRSVVEHPGLARVARCLVVTAGGGPSAKQRAQFNEAIGGAVFSVALVTPSAMARTALGILSRFTERKVKTFAPGALNGALEYLGVPRHFWPQVKATVHAVEAKLGAAPVGVSPPRPSAGTTARR